MSIVHNEELHNLYSSPNFIKIIERRKIGWSRHVATIGERRNPYKVLVGTPERDCLKGRDVRTASKKVCNIRSLTCIIATNFRNSLITLRPRVYSFSNHAVLCINSLHNQLHALANSLAVYSLRLSRQWL
jgi:hypothetical protein